MHGSHFLHPSRLTHSLVHPFFPASIQVYFASRQLPSLLIHPPCLNSLGIGIFIGYPVARASSSGVFARSVRMHIGLNQDSATGARCANCCIATPEVFRRRPHLVLMKAPTTRRCSREKTDWYTFSHLLRLIRDSAGVDLL